jgi:hypothetical protein
MSNYAEFVESRLTSVKCLEKGKCVELAFSLAAGTERKVVAEGVGRMLVQEMREQNVVEYIELLNSTSNAEDVQQAVKVLIVPCECEDPGVYAPIIESTTEQIVAGDHVLMIITPVYGASILLLARKIVNLI